MRIFYFGEIDFTRVNIPDELKDLSQWPTVDHTLLPTNCQSAYFARVEAIRLFVEITSISQSEIERRTGVTRQKIPKLFESCIEEASDNRIQGFRALIPFRRKKVYERKKKVAFHRDGSGGDSGAFGQLLKRYEELEKFLKKQIKDRASKITSVRKVRIDIMDLHRSFRKLCLQLGVSGREYPFNREEQGLRSLQLYIKHEINKNFDLAAHSAGAAYVPPVRVDDGPCRVQPVAQLLEQVQIDGHKIDLRMAIAMPDPFGMETIIEIERVWVLVAMDVATRAALGYSLVVAKEYSSNDVVNAICTSLIPHPPKKLSIPNLVYPVGSGFPSNCFPEMAYACWQWLAFDRAKANLAKSTIALLTRTVGCWPDAGPVRQPIIRGVAERFFHLFSRHFAHKLPGTTGCTPNDIARELGDPGKRLAWLMRLNELEELLDVIIAEHNSESKSALGGRTPLEAVSHQLDRIKENHQRLPHIPSTKRNDLYLLHNEKIVTVRGSASKGKRPHINFVSITYTSYVLQNSPALIGKQIRLRYNENEVSSVKAFYMDGSELGVLAAEHPWGSAPHSLRLRKHIFKEIRKKRLIIPTRVTPIEAYIEQKRKQAYKSKTAATKYVWAIAQVSKEQPPSPSQENSNAESPTANKHAEEIRREPVVKEMRIKQTLNSR